MNCSVRFSMVLTLSTKHCFRVDIFKVIAVTLRNFPKFRTNYACVSHTGEYTWSLTSGIPHPWSWGHVSALAKKGGSKTSSMIQKRAAMLFCCMLPTLHSVSCCVSWLHILYTLQQPGFTIKSICHVNPKCHSKL